MDDIYSMHDLTMFRHEVDSTISHIPNIAYPSLKAAWRPKQASARCGRDSTPPTRKLRKEFQFNANSIYLTSRMSLDFQTLELFAQHSMHL